MEKEKALQNIIRLLKTDKPSWKYGLEQQFWCSCLEVIQQMPGSSKKFKEIASKNDKEELLDTLAEIKYAVIFAELGFKVEVEPFGDKGPDLRISRDDHSSLVEVKRFRPSNSAPRLFGIDELSELDVLPEYGNPPRDWQKIFDAIACKFRQAGDEGIIAIWNNDGSLEPEEVESAAHAHCARSNQKSSFVLFKPDVDDVKLSCFKLRPLIAPHQEKWMTELEQVTPKDILFGPYRRRHASQKEDYEDLL